MAETYLLYTNVLASHVLISVLAVRLMRTYAQLSSDIYT